LIALLNWFSLIKLIILGGLN